MGELGQEFIRALHRVRIRDPQDFDEISLYYGRNAREQNPGIATVISGTTNKRSREYRAAIRKVQRWRTGENQPSARSLRQLAGPVSRSAQAYAYRRGANVKVSGTVTISKDHRPRTITVIIPEAAMAPILTAWRTGDETGAGARFEAAFWGTYGLEAAELDQITFFRVSPL